MLLNLTKKMGFDRDYILSENHFDLESLQSIYPEYKVLKKEDTDFYKEWEKENEKTGITKNAFAKKHDCNFTSKVTAELHKLERIQQKEIESNLEAFIEIYKDEIFHAQSEAIRKSNILSVEKTKEEYLVRKEKWENDEDIKQVINGCDFAISTLEKERDLDLINKFLRIGYKVKCSSASTVFLTWEKEELPEKDNIYKEFPFDSEIPTRQYYVNPERINGIIIPCSTRLAGYIYPSFQFEHRTEYFAY